MWTIGPPSLDCDTACDELLCVVVEAFFLFVFRVSFLPLVSFRFPRWRVIEVVLEPRMFSEKVFTHIQRCILLTVSQYCQRAVNPHSYFAMWGRCCRIIPVKFIEFSIKVLIYDPIAGIRSNCEVARETWILFVMLLCNGALSR